MVQTLIIYADLNEMVFEDRAREYGAYPLRKRYSRRLFLALLLVCFVFASSIAIPRIAYLLGGSEELLPTKPKTKWEMVKLESLNKKEDLPPPVIPPKPKPPKVKQIAYNIPDPTPEEELREKDLDNSINDQKMLVESKNIGLLDQDGLDLVSFFDGEIDGEGVIPEVLIVEPDPSPSDFLFADIEPVPINMGKVQKEIGYPAIALHGMIEGSVIMRVLVDEYGKYKKHIVINQVHPILTKAVEVHIDQLLFTPAIQGNRPIKFWVNIPFKFKIMH